MYAHPLAYSFFCSPLPTHWPLASLCLTVKQAIPVCSQLGSALLGRRVDSHLPDHLSRKADIVEQSDHKRHLDEHARGDVGALHKGCPVGSALPLPPVLFAYTPNNHVALASSAPNSEYTIMPFQKGKGDLVTWARMSWETWYEKLRVNLVRPTASRTPTSCPSSQGTAKVASCARVVPLRGLRSAARRRGWPCGTRTAGSRGEA